MIRLTRPNVVVEPQYAQRGRTDSLGRRARPTELVIVLFARGSVRQRRHAGELADPVRRRVPGPARRRATVVATDHSSQQVVREASLRAPRVALCDPRAQCIVAVAPGAQVRLVDGDGASAQIESRARLVPGRIPKSHDLTEAVDGERRSPAVRIDAFDQRAARIGALRVRVSQRIRDGGRERLVGVGRERLVRSLGLDRPVELVEANLRDLSGVACVVRSRAPDDVSAQVVGLVGAHPATAEPGRLAAELPPERVHVLNHGRAARSVGTGEHRRASGARRIAGTARRRDGDPVGTGRRERPAERVVVDPARRDLRVRVEHEYGHPEARIRLASTALAQGVHLQDRTLAARVEERELAARRDSEAAGLDRPGVAQEIERVDALEAELGTIGLEDRADEAARSVVLALSRARLRHAAGSRGRELETAHHADQPARGIVLERSAGGPRSAVAPVDDLERDVCEGVELAAGPRRGDRRSVELELLLLSLALDDRIDSVWRARRELVHVLRPCDDRAVASSAHRRVREPVHRPVLAAGLGGDQPARLVCGLTPCEAEVLVAQAIEAHAPVAQRNEAQRVGARPRPHAADDVDGIDHGALRIGRANADLVHVGIGERRVLDPRDRAKAVANRDYAVAQSAAVHVALARRGGAGADRLDHVGQPVAVEIRERGAGLWNVGAIAPGRSGRCIRGSRFNLDALARVQPGVEPLQVLARVERAHEVGIAVAVHVDELSGLTALAAGVGPEHVRHGPGLPAHPAGTRVQVGVELFVATLSLERDDEVGQPVTVHVGELGLLPHGLGIRRGRSRRVVPDRRRWGPVRDGPDESRAGVEPDALVIPVVVVGGRLQQVRKTIAVQIDERCFGVVLASAERPQAHGEVPARVARTESGAGVQAGLAHGRVAVFERGDPVGQIVAVQVDQQAALAVVVVRVVPHEVGHREPRARSGGPALPVLRCVSARTSPSAPRYERT